MHKKLIVSLVLILSIGISIASETADNISFNGLNYNVITSPITGKKWLDRNLGATQTCTSMNDSNCFGDYYQWGRTKDGHEKITSSITTQKSTNIDENGADFISSTSFPYDWLDDSNNIDNNGNIRSLSWNNSGVCPTGFKVPSIEEIQAETIDYKGEQNISIGAITVKDSKSAFENFLKLPASTYRYNNAELSKWLNGSLWTTSTKGNYSLYLNSSTASWGSSPRAIGRAIRCISVEDNSSIPRITNPEWTFDDNFEGEKDTNVWISGDYNIEYGAIDPTNTINKVLKVKFSSSSGASGYHFKLPINAVKLSLSWKQYIPANYHHLQNFQKAFTLWSGPTGITNSNITLSTSAWPNEPLLGAVPTIQAGIDGTDYGHLMNYNNKLIFNDEEGKWVDMYAYIELAKDSTHFGRMDIYKNGELLTSTHSDTLLKTYNNISGTELIKYSNRGNFINEGKLFGWANSGFETNTNFLVDDFKILAKGTFETDKKDWKISDKYRVGQKLPMNILSPRPDEETFAYAYHKKASTHFPYKVRLAIQGGEPPFKFEIVEGPAGAKIAETFDMKIDPETGLKVFSLPEDYSTVIWDNPTGDANFNVKVTDQSGESKNIKWSVQTDDDAFVVLDSVNGDDTNPGTWDAPLKTISTGLWKEDINDSSFANKIAVFKTGTYPVYYKTANNNILINAKKPRTFMGIEDGVVLDTSKGHIKTMTGDTSFINMEIKGSRSDLDDTRTIQIDGVLSNFLFWKLKFSDLSVGTKGNDNPAAIMFWDQGLTGYAKNIALVDSELDKSSKIQMIVTFSSDGVLFENNKAIDVLLPDSNGSMLLQAKDDTSNLTIRFNKLIGYASEGLIRLSNQQNKGGLGASNQEVSYNYINASFLGWENAPIVWNQNATGMPNAANTYSYRNTIVTPYIAHKTARWVGGDNVKFSANAWSADYFTIRNNIVDGWYDDVSPKNIKLTTDDIYEDGNLTDVNNARTKYLGKIGWEIATD